MLGDEPDQGQQPDLAIHVERAARQPQRTERTRHRQGHGQHDDEGITKTLELRCQHQVDESQPEHEHHCQTGRAAEELTRLPVVIGRIARRQDARGGLVHPLQGLAQGKVRCQTGRDDHRTALAEVVQLAWGDGLAHLHHVGQRHHVTAARAHVNVADVARIGATGAIQLDDDVVLLGVLLVARHLAAAEHGFQGASDHLHRHAEVGCAIAIHLHRQFRQGQLEVGVGRNEAGVLTHCVEQTFSMERKLIIGFGRRHHERQGTRARALPEGRRHDRKGIHAWHRTQLCTQISRNLARAALTLGPVTKAHEGNALRHRRRTGNHQIAIHLGQGSIDRLDLAPIAAHVVHGRAFGAAENAHYPAAILDRRELGLELAQQQHRTARHQGEHQHHQPAQLERLRQYPAISPRHQVEQALDGVVHRAVPGLMTQQLRAHHRRQRQRHETGHDHRTGQGQRKLGKQLAGAPGHEGYRCVHGGERDRHRHHRKADLLRPLEGGRDRLHTLLDVAIDVLQHDDGIVHHQADRQHQREQGQRVDREAEHQHERERAHQRHRNRHQRHQHCAPVTQEEQAHRRHQQHRLPDGGEHRIDGALDEHRAVIGDVHRHALGQFALQPRHHLVQPALEVERVGGGLLDETDRHRGPAHEAYRSAFVLGRHLDAADVADAHRVIGGCGRRTHHHGLELIDPAQVGLRHHREFALAALDAASGQLHVLLTDGVLHLLHAEAESRQAVSVEPDPHRIAPLAIDTGIRRPGQGLHARLDDAAGKVTHLQRRMAIRREGHPDDGAGVGFDLGNHRLIHIAGQPAAHA